MSAVPPVRGGSTSPMASSGTAIRAAQTMCVRFGPFKNLAIRLLRINHFCDQLQMYHLPALGNQFRGL